MQQASEMRVGYSDHHKPDTLWAASCDQPFSASGVDQNAVVQCDGRSLAEFTYLDEAGQTIRIKQAQALAQDEILNVASVGIAALQVRTPDILRLTLVMDETTAHWTAHLLDSALATIEDGTLCVRPGLFWQQPRPWLGSKPRQAFPEFHIFTKGQRHPLRAPKPEGIVYSRFIPWLGETLSFRTPAIDTDLALFNRWMNEPRIAEIWDEAGDFEKHRRYLETGKADPHNLGLIGCFGDVPFGYFEIYWAKENRLGPFYDADDYDRGWHVAVGEDAFRGKAFVSAWLPSLMHYIFLDDLRTRKIVGEPLASHSQQIRNLERSGFATIKHIDFPHKRSLLVMLLRERFFRDRLWLPARSDKPASAITVQTTQIADANVRKSA